MKLWSALTRVARGADAAQARRAPDGPPTFADLAEPGSAITTPLPRHDPRDDGPGADEVAWQVQGYVIKRAFVPPELVDAYCAVREPLGRPEGWWTPVPYLHVPEIRDLCLYPPLMELLHRLIGDEMGMHLNLTGWVSSERTWHQDHYLNPEFVKHWYCGVWFALDDIHPDSGPIEIVPGSHRWAAMSGERVRARLPEDQARQIAHKHNGDEGHWAKYAETFVTQAFDDEIARVGVAPVAFLGKKGDVLVWHSRLVHRGSPPRRWDVPRKAIITHYSGLAHRPDMTFVRDDNGQPYANFDIPLY